MAGEEKLTSQLFWQSAMIATEIDVIFVMILYRVLRRKQFLQLKRAYILTATLFWGIFGFVLVRVFWESYYRSFYPGWMHTWGILVFAPCVGLVMSGITYWAVARIKVRPILPLIAIIGIEALLEHLLGVYAFGIMNIDLLRGVDINSILAFSVPEYIFYWCVILFLSMGIQKIYLDWRPIRL
jgi:hypothetical protein